MDVKDIYAAKEDVKHIREFANGGYQQYLKENKDCDKYGRGFRCDDRFCAAGKHTIFYSSKRGFYGNSDCSTWLRINNVDLFWKCFDEFLDKNQDMILNAVADLIEIQYKKSVEVVINERDKLNNLIKDLQS